MIISSLNLVRTDKVLDYIPVVSTVTNIVKLAIKALQNIFDKSAANKNHYFAHIHNQSAVRSVALLIPGLGNIVVGIFDFFKNKKANELLKHAIEYRDGIVTRQDLYKSAELMEKAAAKGNAIAQYEAGKINFEGIGVPPDAKKAAIFFRNGAANGNIKAIHAWGFCNLEGCGIEPNAKRAVKLFTEGSDAGLSRSTAVLSNVTAQGVGGLRPDIHKAQILSDLYQKQLAKEQGISLIPAQPVERSFYQIDPRGLDRRGLDHTPHHHHHHHSRAHHHREFAANPRVA